MASAKQSVNRWTRTLDAWESSGEPESRLDHGVHSLTNAIERLCEREQNSARRHQKALSSKALRAPRPTAAETITREGIAAMSWDEVAALSAKHGDDPEALEKLQLLIEEREAAEASANSWDEGAPTVGTGDWCTNPSLRPERRLSSRERAREEYDYYVMSQYARCESELSFMLNREGQAKGVSSLSLFTGPVWRVKRYGSEELQSWFAKHGRHTLGSFRHAMLGWASDAPSARRVAMEGFADAPHLD